MVTLKELFEKTSTVSKRFGVVAIGLDIFNEEQLTPHAEMAKSLDQFERRPLINSGIRQLVRFIIGNDILVEGPDQKSNEWVKKWLDLRPNLKIEIENGVTVGLVTGNLYTESIKVNSKNGKSYFDGIITFPDSSLVYINAYDDPYNEGNVENSFYLIQIPITVRKWDGKSASFKQISYFFGDRIWRASIWCVTYPKSKFKHLRLGYSRNNIYGRSYISSTLDDATVLREILKNIAIISRYRALNSKIIMPAASEDEILEDDIQNNEKKLFEARDGSHIFMNKRVDIQSFSNTNEYDTMINEIDFIRREIGSGLVPNFITSFNSDVNRATAQEAKIPFQLEIDYLKNIFEEYYSDIILKELRASFPGAKIHPDTKLKFKPVDLETRSDKSQYMLQLFSSGLITMNEARIALDLPAVANGNKYSTQMSAPEDSAMKLLNSVIVKEGLRESDIREKNDSS